MLMLDRTIHGMVYNAMKLFMEVNPQLFDECSHDYTEQQNNADAIKQNRQAKWDRLSQLAESMKQQNGHAAAPAVRPPDSGYNTNGRNGAAKALSPIRQDPGDPLAQDSQRRLEQLRLQDDRDRRPAERHGNSVR
jgi:serine/threonine-protein phosphatase 2A regulatory subunit B'